MKTIGKLPSNLKLESISVEPKEVKLVIPAKLNNPPKKVYTEEVDLNGITESGSVQSKFIPPEKSRLPLNQEADVVVNIKVKTK